MTPWFNKLQRRLVKVGKYLSFFKGQKGQDRWVILEVLPFKRGGFFVDLAATNGVFHNNTFVLEKYFGWQGICVEPNPRFFAQLQKRRKCFVSNAVVGETVEDVQFRIDNGPLGGIVAEDTDNNPRVRGNQFKQAEIVTRQTIPLTELLASFNAPKIMDYLSLDVEGSEERVLRGFDFHQYQFRCLTIERPTPRVNEMLFQNGYVFVKNHQFDTFYVHRSILNERPLRLQPFEQVPAKDW
ncbi:MAG: hypothetical protein Fur0022_21400 [Anaerolineales bacterium]